MSNFEIELRYQVLQPKQLLSFLASFEKLHQKHDVDIYLDTPEALLYQRGIFIRLRNNKKLDFKFNRACLDNPELAMQDYCEEYSFELPLRESDLLKINELLTDLKLKTISSADVDILKSVNNFGIHYIIDKVRTTYKHDLFTFGLDEVADLGTFLEIELMANSIENLTEIRQHMQKLLKGLALEPLRTGYGTISTKEWHYLEAMTVEMTPGLSARQLKCCGKRS